MLLLVLTLVMAVVTSPVLIQNPTDVRFDIAIKEPKNVFRIGEEIDLEFRFSCKREISAGSVLLSDTTHDSDICR